MIYTVTLNSAIDYVMYFKDLENHVAASIELGKVNRASHEELLFGGKGTDVSAVLKNLGEESVALGFISGFTGNALKNELDKKGIMNDSVETKNGMTRIMVKIKSDVETELNGSGSCVNIEDIETLHEKLSNLENGDYLVLSESVSKMHDKNMV